MTKIGFFGGTFDPPHNGHIHLALSLLEIYSLDSVVFCPAEVSPFKSGIPPIARSEDRLAMVQKAVAPIPTFKVWDWEMRHNHPSYTIDAVKAFLSQCQQEHKNVSLHLILGQDALPRLHEWKDIEELLRIAPPLIGTRAGVISAMDLSPFSRASQAAIVNGLTEIPLLDISSTFLRERLGQRPKRNLYCGHLIPGDTLRHIYEHGLYEQS